MNRFGELLRSYRLRCTCEDRSLTQEKLGGLLGEALGGAGYTGAAISDWERGKSQIDKDQRLVLVGLLQVLYKLGGLQNAVEANTMLLAGNYRPLNDEETLLVFHARDSAPSQQTGALWHLIVLVWNEIVWGPVETTKMQMPISGGASPRWTDWLLGIIGWAFRGWTLERVLRWITWIGIGVLIWILTFPMLDWRQPWVFESPSEARWRVLLYCGGALILPTLIACFTNTRHDPFWQQLKLDGNWLLRFYTYLGAQVGFHVAFLMVFTLALLWYYLQLEVPLWLVGLSAAWILLVSHAAAHEVPFNQWRAFGRFLLSDGGIFAVFFGFGPFFGWYFYTFGLWLLQPLIAIPVGFLVIGFITLLTLWQRRSRYDAITASTWTTIFGIVLVLFVASTGNLFLTVATIGMVAVLASGLSPRRFTWRRFIVSTVCELVSVVVFALLARRGGVPITSASIGVSIATLVILWFQTSQRFR